MRKFYFLLIVPLMLALVMFACQIPTPTPTASPPATPTPLLPTPTAESPLPTPTPFLSPLPSPTPPESPLETPQTQVSSRSEFWVEYGQDVPVYTAGYTPTLFFAAKLIISDTVVYSETIDTGLAAPTITDTAGVKFDGSVFFDYPLLEVDASEWANCWWVSDGEMYAIGADEQLELVDRVACIYEGDTQDGQGYWLIGTIQGMGEKNYCPIVLGHDGPTSVTLTPTSMPEVGTEEGRVPTWAVVVAIFVVGFLALARYVREHDPAL